MYIFTYIKIIFLNLKILILNRSLYFFLNFKISINFKYDVFYPIKPINFFLDKAQVQCRKYCHLLTPYETWQKAGAMETNLIGQNVK